MQGLRSMRFYLSLTSADRVAHNLASGAVGTGEPSLGVLGVLGVFGVLGVLGLLGSPPLPFFAPLHFATSPPASYALNLATCSRARAIFTSCCVAPLPPPSLLPLPLPPCAPHETRRASKRGASLFVYSCSQGRSCHRRSPVEEY